jgi:hypothetical protein
MHVLMANFGKESKPIPLIAKMTQETLAEMIGTTRSRVKFFLNLFRELAISSTAAAVCAFIVHQSSWCFTISGGRAHCNARSTANGLGTGTVFSIVLPAEAAAAASAQSAGA